MTVSLADVQGNEIERLTRALMAQLTPLTGTRATGTARVVSSSGVDVPLPPNAYAIPIVDGQTQEPLLVKARHNPATTREHLLGGDWTVTPAGTTVTFEGNNGGAIWNVIAPGSKLRFQPAVPGIEPLAEVLAPGFGGGAVGPVKQIVSFDELGPQRSFELFKAKVGDFPAIVLAWISSQPVEGRTGGISQGATRKRRGVRAYFETFSLNVVVSSSESAEARRREGLVVMQAARRLLTDRMRNDDGEVLSVMGTGVEILGSVRMPRTESSWVFVVTLRCITTECRAEGRTFQPWELTRIRSFDSENPPANPDELTLHDFTVPMPQEPPD